MRISIEMEPQIKAPRVAPLEGASTYAPAGAYVSMHCGGHDADERRFVESDIQSIFVTEIDSNLINSPQRAQSSQRSFLPFEIESEKILQERNGTRMTRIGRIFTDPRVSVSSAQSVFYRDHSPMKNPLLSAFICVDPRLINRAGGV